MSVSFVYRSNATLSDIASALSRAATILITTHAKPDGDAIGSAAALGHALHRQGKDVTLCIMPPITDALACFAAGLVTLERTAAQQHQPMTIEPDLIVVVDTGAWNQLEPMEPFLAARRHKTILIDHHLHGNDIAQMRYIDPSAAACAQIIAALLDEMDSPYDLPIANALFVGIASDTGWFRFSNTNPATHELAARLIRLGVDHAALYVHLEQAERPEKLSLLIRALQSMELLAGGTVAVMTLRLEDFAQTGARPEETERFVDVPQMVASVQVVVMVTQSEAGRVRMSFRSKPGADAVDVNQLASRFGGGGHARAAGAKVSEPIETVLQRVRQIFTGSAVGVR
jgi:phosphoesterase RecJ-like protein